MASILRRLQTPVVCHRHATRARKRGHMKQKRHPFDVYFRTHNHYPQLRIANGVQQLTVEFAPGYVRLQTSSPFGGEIYITRSAFLRLLRRSVPIARRWSRHPDFDVPQRVHEEHLQEMQHLAELRQQKRDRVEDPERRARQHQRWMKAKARARKSAAD